MVHIHVRYMYIVDLLQQSIQLRTHITNVMCNGILKLGSQYDAGAVSDTSVTEKIYMFLVKMLFLTSKNLTNYLVGHWKLHDCDAGIGISTILQSPS